jgi:hypothetical protein
VITQSGALSKHGTFDWAGSVDKVLMSVLRETLSRFPFFTLQRRDAEMLSVTVVGAGGVSPSSVMEVVVVAHRSWGGQWIESVA